MSVSFGVHFSILVSGFLISSVLSCNPSSSNPSPRMGRRRSDDDAGGSLVRFNSYYGKIHRLNSGEELLAITTNIRASEGRGVYGRLEVPFGQHSYWRLTVSAFWTDSYSTTPMWLYIRKSRVPSKTSFDKSSVSFVSRKVSRIRMDRASPGSYFVFLEALVDIRNVTIGVSLIPSKLIDRNAVPVLTEMNYRPNWESDWLSQNEVK